MDKLLDIIAKWDHFGQGIFFLILAGMTLTSLCWLWFHLVVLIRGWPPPGTKTPRLPEL